MISKQKIKNTLVCYWSSEDESFVAESSLLPDVVIGTGDSKGEAINSFDSALNNSFKEIETDNVAGYKMGRPAKGYVAFNSNIRPGSRATISQLAEELDISQGEVVDYLVFYYNCKLQEENRVPEKDELIAALTELKSSLIIKLDRITEKTDDQVRIFNSYFDYSKSRFDEIAAPLQNMQHLSALNIVVGNQTALRGSDAISALSPTEFNTCTPFQVGWPAYNPRMAAV